MDRRVEWPWSWEEEVEWKAELEERDNEFLDELLANAVEDRVPDSSYGFGLPSEEEPSADSAPEKYLIAA